MKKSPPKIIAFLFAIGVALFCEASQDAGGDRQTRDTVKLNKDAVEYVKRLIAEGHFVTDKRGAWDQYQPSAEEENRFIQLHGFDEYAKWHLGIDERHAPNTKARYKFPCGDFKNVRRSALLAAQSRAGQFKHSDIEAAAISLRKMMETQAALESKQ
jgi:hypothetical protein